MFEEQVSRLYEYLRLKTSPVGIKLSKDAEELLKHGKRPRQKATICQLTSQARIWGRVLAATLDDLICARGATAIGFRDYPEDIASGERDYNRHFGTVEAGRLSISKVPKIETRKYSAILVAPLTRMPVEPDLVLVVGDSAQMLRLVQGILWRDEEEGRLYFGSNGTQGVCADAIANAMITGRPSMGIPCYGARMFGGYKDDELVMAILLKFFDATVEGLMESHKVGGMVYPIVTQGIDVTPYHPAALYVIQPEVKK